MKAWGCLIGIPLIVVALILIAFGFLFIIASTAGGQLDTGTAGTGGCMIFVSLILIAVGGLILYKGYGAAKRDKTASGGGSQTTIVHQVDLPGDLSMEQIKCESCGAPLNKSSISVKEGAVVVECPYCGATYEIEEKPKW